MNNLPGTNILQSDLDNIAVFQPDLGVSSHAYTRRASVGKESQQRLTAQ